ncbi:hypothetical protein [Neorickettsia sennetsu]|uniref:hypothetical protein n=1 Tax=Ehrlichia sennetsu TaxID=951 RepID=UPI001D051B80|nr:hypothetical protein [Neorickettsia sennetsu]
METLIQTDIFALDTVLELNLSLKNQQEKLNSMKMLLQEAENSFNEGLNSAMGMANESEKLIQGAMSSLLDTLQAIVLFANPNKTRDPMLPTKYRENITIRLRETHKKFLSTISKLHLYNEIPTHEKATEYIYKIFQDATTLVVDVLEKSGREQQEATYEEYENKAQTNRVNSFTAITAPQAYRKMVTETLTQANPTLESEALIKLIEDTIKSETTAVERTIQILGEHAKKYAKEGESEKELGKSVLKSIEQVRDLVRTSLVQHIAGLIKIKARFSVEPVDPAKLKQRKDKGKSQRLFNLVMKKIIQFKEKVGNAKKNIPINDKPTKGENPYSSVLKKQFEESTKTTPESKNTIKEKRKSSPTVPEKKPSIGKTAMTKLSNNGILKNQKKLSFDMLKKETFTPKTNNVVQQKKDASTQTENIVQQKRDASSQTGSNIVISDTKKVIETTQSHR